METCISKGTQTGKVLIDVKNEWKTGVNTAICPPPLKEKQRRQVPLLSPRWLLLNLSAGLLYSNWTKAPSNAPITTVEGTLTFNLGIRRFHLARYHLHYATRGLFCNLIG